MHCELILSSTDQKLKTMGKIRKVSEKISNQTKPHGQGKQIPISTSKWKLFEKNVDWPER